MRSKHKFSFFNKDRNCYVASKASWAANLFTKLRGLLGTDTLPAGEGLYLERCNQIHMFGMRYAIDVVFIDKKSRVIGLCHEIGPGRISPAYWNARGCLEVPAGTILDTGTQIGDEIEIVKLP